MFTGVDQRYGNTQYLCEEQLHGIFSDSLRW